MMYEVEVRVDDAHLLPVTNIGAWSDHPGSEEGWLLYCTDSEEVFSAWCEALKVAGKEFRSKRI